MANANKTESAITAEQIQLLLRNQIIGNKIYSFRQLGSTNDYIRRLAQNGEDEGAVVISDAQTRGRGRYQRAWLSPPGKGLWFSVLLRPKSLWDRVGLVSLLASLAVADGIVEQTALQPQLKWPNDVLIDGKKVCGILIETETQNGSPEYLCLGIGINVNHEEADFPESLRQRATSLFVETGKAISRTQLLVSVLHNVEEYYRRFSNGEYDYISSEWLTRCFHKNSTVKVTRGDNVIEGLFERIDSGGQMLLRTRNGEICRIQSGEVTQLAFAHHSVIQ